MYRENWSEMEFWTFKSETTFYYLKKEKKNVISFNNSLRFDTLCNRI